MTEVIKETTTQEVSTAPEVKGEAPQKVYNKKKTIFRFNQVIWYILGLIEVLIAFRFILKLLGANPTVGFSNLIYSLTAPLVGPFNGIFGTPATGSSVMDLAALIAGIVYLCVAYGLVYLLNLIYPITPNDVETQ